LRNPEPASGGPFPGPKFAKPPCRSSTGRLIMPIRHIPSNPILLTVALAFLVTGALAAQPSGDQFGGTIVNMEGGYSRVKGGLGYPVAAARSKPDAGGGRVIRLMIDRPLSSREEANSLRSADYPFSYVELHLDAGGKGDGMFIAAAKVTLDVNNTVDIESLGVQPFKLLDVHSSR